ncbi:hypothetical protein ACDH60_25215 [Pseudomonas ficuserectae]|uniref:Uncharacterized protein n=1 Tax=Pseudomonas amygdali pv. lachrymans TaxID=53707 RepID=A0AB37R791_PSEAV|nr:hypothetical protein [Pseudomonas amygdali]ARA80210.1 hypothetical protein B5U27_09150 [Pseudomonas amygdali pv. lachrymans]KKY52182.1 hypothetical protein AAY85_27335 [Pseudomonas amygdali pv. lachrymans]KPC05029.1 Unknown protein sequence [Pseudomonas amygdali pv. lachrymans]RMM42288.1 hypothetical protein ALQ79_02214 [Pseudomonas amygdali pv. lachrymans]RMP44866.1 hypothetical protein ALQ26_01804 [Pseudomonas amygdali pv. lachrymans]
MQTTQTNRTNFEAGFALLKIPFASETHAAPNPGSADMFKRASVLTESNTKYAAKCEELRKA